MTKTIELPEDKQDNPIAHLLSLHKKGEINLNEIKEVILKRKCYQEMRVASEVEEQAFLPFSYKHPAEKWVYKDVSFVFEYDNMAKWYFLRYLEEASVIWTFPHNSGDRLVLC